MSKPLLKTEGQWHDGLCSCIGDPGLCCLVCLCSPIPTAQLYERSAQLGLIERAHSTWGCVSIALFLYAGYVLSELLSGTNDETCMALAALARRASHI